MTRNVAAAAGILAVLTFANVQATTPPGFEDTLVATVTSPTGLAFTPDGRLLIAAQGGSLHVVQNGTLLPTSAIDLSANLCTNSERGLLGVAVDPSFATNRFIYVYYTLNKSGVCEQNTVRSPVNRVSRFVLPASNVISRSTEVILIDNIPSPNGNHNGGDLHFGKDGYLYISIGDGGCDYMEDSGCAGSNDASRDQHVLLGKLLRITRDGAIPPDNPFQGAGTARCNNGRTTAGTKCQETYAWGFRNPFRFATDPNATGTRIFVNDVGQGAWEEIDLVVAGADYGWNIREGNCATGSTTDCGAPPPGLTNPIHAYGHGSGCASITGGAFVPAGIWPATYDGAYLFGDYVCGTLFTLRQGVGGSYTQSPWVTELGNNSATAMTFGPYGTTQALYYASYADGGQIRRIAYTGNRSPTAVASASPRSGTAPLSVRFDASGSTDPDGDVLTYDWNFLDGTPHGTTAVVTHTYNAGGQYDAVVTVTDTKGAATTAMVRINVGNTPPVPQIVAPTTTSRFAVGEAVALRGAATDAEQGALADSALSWTVLLHHDSHTHPFLGPSAGNGVTFTAPAPEDLAATSTSYLEIRLTATDAAGASATVVQRFDPRLVTVTLATEPAGLTIAANATSVVGPATVTSWAGYVLRLTAGTQDDAGGQPWLPTGWSDGGPSEHTVVTPSADTTYSASFAAAMRLGASADAFVRGGSYASTNFGARSTVDIMQSATAGNAREAYLRFDLRNVATVGVGRLRLYGAIGDARSVNVPVTIQGAPNTTWTETGLTWNNRPPSGTAVLATATIPDAIPRWHEWDVTPYLQAEKAAGRNLVTLVVRSSAASLPYLAFVAREYSSFDPELLVAAAPVENRAPTALASASPLSGPAPLAVRFDASGSSDPDGDALTYDWDFLDGAPHGTTAVVTHTYNSSGQLDAIVTVTDSKGAASTATVRIDVSVAAPVRIGVSADAFVRGGTYASRNFGTRTAVEIMQSPTAANVRETYLRFDLGTVATVGSGRLRLYGATTDTRSVNVPVTVQGVSNTTWTETGLTWTNRPPSTTAVLATATILDANPRWYEWDITPYLQAEKAAGRNLVTLVLRSGSATLPYLVFVAREYGSLQPELIVTIDSEAGGPPDIEPMAHNRATVGAPAVRPSRQGSHATR